MGQEELTPGKRALLETLSRLYYEEEQTQDYIAKQLKLSRPMVCRLLKKARRLGVVHIEVVPEEREHQDLLQKLLARYALKGGLLAPGSDQTAFWRRCALFLSNELEEERNLGLGWGLPIDGACKALTQLGHERQEGAVYPLIGNGQQGRTDELVQRLARLTGRKAYLLKCPALYASYDDRAAYEGSKAYAQVSGLWRQLDVAIVGIKCHPSAPDEATATRFGDALDKQRAVGCFLSYYFNQRGEFISGNNDFCLRIPLSQLGRCPKVIAIASHADAKAVDGALRTGLISHIVLPKETALELVGGLPPA